MEIGKDGTSGFIGLFVANVFTLSIGVTALRNSFIVNQIESVLEGLFAVSSKVTSSLTPNEEGSGLEIESLNDLFSQLIFEVSFIKIFANKRNIEV